MFNPKLFVVLLLVFAVVALALTGLIPTYTDAVPSTRSMELPEGEDPLKLYVRIAISILFAVAGLFVVLSKRYETGEKNWAFATLGTIVGFWLK